MQINPIFILAFVIMIKDDFLVICFRITPQKST